MSYGVLKPYVEITQTLNPIFLKNIIDYANQIDGYLCYMQIPLIYTISKFTTGKVVEIGVWKGRTTSIIYAGNNELDITAVDIFTGSEEHQEMLNGANYRTDFEKNMSDRGVKVKIIEEYSAKAADSFEDNSLDLVWIDAAHDYKNVVLDIESWLPKLKKGGMMCGHDYPEPSDPNGGFKELAQAVNEKVRDSSNFSDFGWSWGIWAAKKA